MALIVTERSLADLVSSGDKSAIYWAYNALDCAITREVRDCMPALTEAQSRIYRFEHKCQAPALAMTLRGVLIDQTRRGELITLYEQEQEDAETEVSRLAALDWTATRLHIGNCGLHRGHLWPRGIDPGVAICRRCGVPRLVASPLNAGSFAQVATLLYENLGVRVRKDRKTGQPSVGKEAIESIIAEHARLARERTEGGEAQARHARIVAICTAYREAARAGKQAGYARSRLGDDGRMRAAFNVGAAETGRWSSSSAPDRQGWNIQQISERLRGMVVADPGLEIWNADFKSAESQIVAYDAQDGAYIDAHQQGDVHTFVAKLVWPELPWPDDSYLARVLAETKTDFDPNLSYRDYAKHVQHGGNIGQSPAGMARDAHITEAHAAEVYRRMYDEAFPMVRARQREIRATVQRERQLTTPLGRPRQFLGRTWDDATQREALCQTQQGTVADLCNLALYRVWRELDTRANIHDSPHASQPNRVWLLAQGHDALLGLRRKGDDAALLRVRELMTIPILIHGRLCTIPVEITVGPSWSKKELTLWTG